VRDSFEGNLEMYEDPVQYDELYDHVQEELAFVLENTKWKEEPIIELACGTGRITIPMATLGFQMIGVDIHTGMLQRAQEKAKRKELSIQWIHQDCTKLDLSVQSPFIYMTGNSFQHFLTNWDQDELFTSVKKHLLPNGEFIFDTRNPILLELAEGEDLTEETTNSHNQKIIKRDIETYDPLTQILHCTTTIERIENKQVIHHTRSAISLRYTFPLELKRLLNSHGFEIINLYGSWKKNTFNESSVSMVVHCRLKG